MSWWVYKCNAQQLDYQGDWGDWDDFFEHNRKRWGSTKWVPALAKLKIGDLIIAYQTDRNELVGLAKVRQSCQQDTYLYLDPMETLGVKVRPLKRADPQISAIPALKPGPIQTVYEVSDSDARRLLAAAGAKSITTSGAAPRVRRTETAKTARPISGDKLYQLRARQALPLLVRQARAATPIYYSDFAHELGMPNPRNLNYVLGSIGTALERLSKKWKEKIPPIQCLVVNKATGLPGEGIGWFITKKDDFRKLPRKQQRFLVHAELQKVFGYPRWSDVLRELKLQPVQSDFSRLITQVAGFRAGGESEDHRRLKLYVAAHPESVGLGPGASAGIVEHPLPSGDTVDVLFQTRGDWVAVEVKSSLSSSLDIARGLFQCIKYRAVVEAVQATENLDQNARAILVLESTLPTDLVGVKNTLGVEVIENMLPRDG